MEEEKYFIGDCPVCGSYGQLEILYDMREKKCSIECEECLLEFKNPKEALKKINGYRKNYSEEVKAFGGPIARSATLEEIRKAGWEKYIAEVRYGG